MHEARIPRITTRGVDGSILEAQCVHQGGAVEEVKRFVAGLREHLTPYIGKAIVCGFRPEYLYDKNQEGQQQPGIDLNILIDVTEPVGSETYNYFHFAGKEDQTFCFRSDSAQVYRPGEALNVGIDIH